MVITEIKRKTRVCIECKEEIKVGQYFYVCQLREKLDDKGKSYKVRGENNKYVHSGCFLTKKWGAK